MAIKKGDVVTLKSGSVDMTVESIEEINLPGKPKCYVAHCVWFINGDDYKNANFDIDALEPS